MRDENQKEKGRGARKNKRREGEEFASEFSKKLKHNRNYHHRELSYLPYALRIIRLYSLVLH